MLIEQIWQDFENDYSAPNGLLIRRYNSSIFPNVFLALKNPEKLRCIAVSLQKSVHVDLRPFNRLKDMKLELRRDDKDKHRNLLLFTLLNKQYADIFSTLCVDLFDSIATIDEDTTLAREMLNRFEKWNSLFCKAALQGLSSEQQQGLYGELFLLKKMLLHFTNHSNVLSSWVGPDKQSRDFQYGTWAIEVKTTHSKNHQKIHISNEKQLDITNIDSLFLNHISLDMLSKSGESLNDICQSILQILEPDYTQSNRFKAKLYEAGYYEHQSALYEDTGYLIRQNNYYCVQGDFPRIEESEIRKGVGDVHYSIILSQPEKYRISEDELFNKTVFV